MGYYRSVYAGPVFRCIQKNTKIPRYEVFRKVEHDLDSERLHLLQENLESKLGDAYIAPFNSDKNPRKFYSELNEDIALSVCETDLSSEKDWLIQEYKKELEILIKHYLAVDIAWAVVVDGS